eukprot:CAMPEP_0175047072 /NCGR_PEP_ID=MMETSP0052_2-20121109/5386_1 /TAXON_ID=51329 ORGANISM="Polytomella parva, Strain SAG 63-3" /NCGR_SAMPLE_ID=MMETSP0052_2 /ASSEMBLY_ACC=CAM_ASM_000194 /LENGTH=237 /DNA_ID=CAMNT_0016310895 /DNA_START=69 /DNA_END=782 /DNA_ORIENTATION=+
MFSSTSRVFVTALTSRVCSSSIAGTKQVYCSINPLLDSFRAFENNGIPLFACGLKKAASQICAGDILDRDGAKLQVTKFMWNHGAARASGFISLEMVDLVTGSRTSNKYKIDENLETIDLEKKEMQVIYTSDGKVTLMDSESFEQVEVEESLFGDGKKWLTAEDLTVEVRFHNNEPVYGIVPPKLSVKVVSTPPKDGDPDNTRHVVVEGGHLVAAPGYIKVGDVITIKTIDGSYAGK